MWVRQYCNQPLLAAPPIAIPTISCPQYTVCCGNFPTPQNPICCCILNKRIWIIKVFCGVQDRENKLAKLMDKVSIVISGGKRMPQWKAGNINLSMTTEKSSTVELGAIIAYKGSTFHSITIYFFRNYKSGQYFRIVETMFREHAQREWERCSALKNRVRI